jgi:hypothetical protein
MRKYIQYALRPGTGRTLPQASVSIKANPSTELSPNVAVYNANDAIPANEITQPFLCTAAGLLEFYAPSGRYDIYITYADISYTLQDVFISSDSVSTTSVEDMHVITTQTEPALTNEIVIPTFLGHPDSPPASPNASDDEFGTVDAAWSEYNGSGTFTVGNSRLRYTSSVPEITPCVGYEKTLVLTNLEYYTFTSLVRFGYSPGHNVSSGEINGDRPFWGIGFRTDSNNVISFGLRATAQGISVSYMKFDASSLVDSETCHIVGANACYLRITMIDYDNIKLEWSTEGLTWVLAKRIVAQPFTGIPSKIGFYAYNAIGSMDGYVDNYADFFRVVQIPYLYP